MPFDFSTPSPSPIPTTISPMKPADTDKMVKAIRYDRADNAAKEIFVRSARLAWNTNGQVYSTTQPHYGVYELPDGRQVPVGVENITVSERVVAQAEKILAEQAEMEKKMHILKCDFVVKTEDAGLL